MKRTYDIEVVGKSGKRYCFTFKGDPVHVQGWREEGFVVDEVLNSIPLWAQQAGLTHVWIAAQDAWRFMRLW